MRRKKKNVNWWKIGGIVGLILFLLWLGYKIYQLFDKMASLEFKHEELNNQVVIIEQPADLEGHLNELILYYKPINQDIHEELKIALKRHKAGEDSETARVITKIIETVLKEISEREDSVWYLDLKKKAKISLYALLKRFNERGILNNQDYQFALRMKDLRNMNSHELNVEGRIDFNEKRLNLHVGIMILQKLIVQKVIA